MANIFKVSGYFVDVDGSYTLKEVDLLTFD